MDLHYWPTLALHWARNSPPWPPPGSTHALNYPSTYRVLAYRHARAVQPCYIQPVHGRVWVSYCHQVVWSVPAAAAPCVSSHVTGMLSSLSAQTGVLQSKQLLCTAS